MQGTMQARGTLTAHKVGAKMAPMKWRIRNALRWTFIWGWLVNLLARGFSKLTGIVTITSELAIRVRKSSGEWINYGVVSRRVVTDAFVAYVVDDWDGGANVIDNFNYHGCGTGTNAEAAGDTALQTEATTILNPDSTRATGTKSQPAANQMRSVGTVTFDGVGSITEHSVFSQAATGGGTPQDRSVFASIGVGSGDSIQFTYTMTLNSGG